MGALRNVAETIRRMSDTFAEALSIMFTCHPMVYFWLLPAYISWYTLGP
jgi:hypothetical protein